MYEEISSENTNVGKNSILIHLLVEILYIFSTSYFTAAGLLFEENKNWVELLRTKIRAFENPDSHHRLPYLSIFQLNFSNYIYLEYFLIKDLG